MSVRKIALLATLAAVVPVSAVALTGGGSAPAGLSVSASLGSCGVAGEQIYCSLDAGFTGVPGAKHYTASVTLADGSVQDFGRVAQGASGGGASLWVPYVGAGTYTVRVAAYGTPPGEDEGRPELLDEDTAEPTNGFQPLPNNVGRGSAPQGGRVTVPGSRAQRDDGRTRNPPSASTPPAPSDEPAPPAATPEPVPPEPPAQTLPPCQPAPPPPPPDSGDGSAPTPEATAPEQPPIECTAPSTDYRGPCCPPGG